jgi:hypothetical protein
MNRKHDAAAAAKQRHEAPIEADDMKPSLTDEAPETEAIEDDGEPIGDNFA